MRNHPEKGSALVMAIAAILVIILVGVAFVWITRLMGGGKEIQNATEAGVLNIAKAALANPKVTLDATELAQYGAANGAEPGQADATGSIDLFTYNKLVGQTLLVAMNAVDEGTGAAKDNASKLIDDLNKAGASLTSGLQTPNNMTSYFNNESTFNPMQMFGVSTASANMDTTQYGTAFLKATDASNIALNPKSYTAADLPAGATVNRQSPAGFNYLAGYLPLQPNIGAFAAVPLRPGVNPANGPYGPHLVSLTEFNSNLTPPADTGNVPPNGFKAAATSAVTQNNTASAVSSAVVGALDTTFTASIPRGYIVITNGAPLSFNAATEGPLLSSGMGIFGNQLMTGITVGPGGIFTEDANLYNQWLTYNTDVAKGITPPLPAPPPTSSSVDGFHPAGANPDTITAPGTPINYLDYGQDPTPLAASMLGAFQTAYASSNPPLSGDTSFSSNNLNAAEIVKLEIVAAEYKVVQVHDPSAPGYTAVIPGATSGILYMPHSDSFAYPGDPLPSQAATLSQLLSADICNAPGVLAQVTQRLYQISPSATNVAAILNTPIPMGQTVYIYGDANGNLTSSTTKPSWATSTTADGKTSIIGNPWSGNMHQYDVDRDGTHIAIGAPSGTLIPFANSSGPPMAEDFCSWTPSSGYNGLLGVMSFEEDVSWTTPTMGGPPGTGTYFNPN